MNTENSTNSVAFIDLNWLESKMAEESVDRGELENYQSLHILDLNFDKESSLLTVDLQIVDQRGLLN